MKTQLTAILILIGIFLGTSHVMAATEERNVPAFTEISLRVPAKVHISQGKNQSVEIVAKESAMSKIITEVKGRELIIRMPTKNKIWSDFETGKVEIFITIPEITKLSVAGSGDIINDGVIKSTIMDLTVSGSGDIILDDLKSERVNAAISGSGNISLAGGGKTVELSVTISGSGGFKGPGFVAEDISVKSSGSGNAVVNAQNTLKIRASGSANVSYKGNPRVDSSTSGSGKITALDY